MINKTLKLTSLRVFVLIKSEVFDIINLKS